MSGATDTERLDWYAIQNAFLRTVIHSTAADLLNDRRLSGVLPNEPIARRRAAFRMAIDAGMNAETIPAPATQPPRGES